MTEISMNPHDYKTQGRRNLWYDTVFFGRAMNRIPEKSLLFGKGHEDCGWLQSPELPQLDDEGRAVVSFDVYRFGFEMWADGWTQEEMTEVLEATHLDVCLRDKIISKCFGDMARQVDDHLTYDAGLFVEGVQAEKGDTFSVTIRIEPEAVKKINAHMDDKGLRVHFSVREHKPGSFH